MSGMLKHVGQIVNTGKRCVIAFLQIPDLEDHALVIETDALPDRFHQPLMELLQSSEGQNSAQLADVLGRRILAVTGRTMLESLHTYGYLTRMPITNIVLMPRPNQAYPLKDVLLAMGRNITPALKTNVPTELTEAFQQIPAQELVETPVADQIANVERGFFSQNRQADDFDSKLQIAKGLLSQAEMIEEDARQIRNRAYQMVPDLNPAKALTEQKLQSLEATDESQEGTATTGNRRGKRKAA